jgi:hypothetical protein
MLYSFKIYDTHEHQFFDNDNSLNIKVLDYWNKFDLTISHNDLWITSFREYVLIDENSNPTECTKVYLSDGSFVYAVVKYDTFKKNYQEFLDTTKAPLDTP